MAVIDDVPREDFLPRQRHTLKEFAVGDFIEEVVALLILICAGDCDA